MRTRLYRTGVSGLALALAAVFILHPHPSPGNDPETPAQAEEKPAKPFPPVTLTLRTDKTEYCRVEPIVVECEFVNHSEDVEFSYFSIWGPYFAPHGKNLVFHLEVTQQGEKMPLTRYGSVRGTGFSGSNRKLLPGTKTTWRILINAFFDMTEDGEYVITGSIPVMGHYGDPKREPDGFLLEAEPIRVTVKDCPL